MWEKDEGSRTRLPGDGSRPLESLRGEKIVVVGLGASGHAAARLALKRGGTVHATDIATDAETAAVGDELRSLGARVELGSHRLASFEGAAAVVVSPGIPPEAPVLRDLREAGIPWISELEFAFRFLPGALIAVTGTNGKTTTAALTAHLLREAGFEVGLGGNIGAGLGPAASELALVEPAPEWCVVEASSFQLADVEWFRPDVGVLTNLAPDHLDRYPDTDAYYADKARLFERADADSHWILNAEDPEVVEMAGAAKGTRHWFGVDTARPPEPLGAGERSRVRGGGGGGTGGSAGGGAGGGANGGPAGAFEGVLEGGRIVVRRAGTSSEEDPSAVSVDRGAVPLLGRHNVANALAAALAARAAGADARAVERGLTGFRTLEHRLEPVGEVGGVLWVNDSKATNVAAALSAVESLDRTVVLLLGGKDKGEDLGPLRRLGEAGVRSVVAYGAAGERIAEALEGVVPLRRIDGTFEDAVRAGAEAAEPGDALLLSPACSSYDMFESYELRGRRFRELAAGAGGRG